MKKLLAIVLASWSIAVFAAKEYQIIVPSGPGSSSDVVSRAISDAYHEITGNNLLLEYAPGGDHIIAVNRLTNSSRRPTVLLGTTTMNVFNHVLKDDLSYSDKDFDYVAWIGWSSHVWYVSAASSLTTMKDLADALNKNATITVGTDALSTQVNVLSVPNKKNLIMVKYKSSTATMTDVMGQHVDLGVSTLSQVILENVRTGRLRILGTTGAEPLVVDKNIIERSSPVLNARQFDGGFGLQLLASTQTSDEGLVFRQDLLKTLEHPIVKNALSSIMVTSNNLRNSEVLEMYRDYRESVRELVRQ